MTDMVRTLNVTLDDDDFERARELKEEIGLTWEGFVKQATRALEERQGTATAPRASERGPAPADVDERDADEPAVTTEPADTPDDPIRAALEGWRPGRSREEREERRAAGQAVLEYLRQRGEAEKRDFLEDLYPDHAPPGQGEDTFWRKTARGDLDEGTGALARAIAAGLVEYEQGPPHVYRWVGEEPDA